MNAKTTGTSVPAQANPQDGSQHRGSSNGGRIAAALLKYACARPGQPLFRDEIVAETGLTPDQVRIGMANMRASNYLGAREALEIVVAGQTWVWHPNKARTEATEAPAPEAAPTKRLFAEIGTTREGDLILQADDGTLWRATEL